MHQSLMAGSRSGDVGFVVVVIVLLGAAAVPEDGQQDCEEEETQDISLKFKQVV